MFGATMASVGLLFYGTGRDPVEIDDRVLAHLKVVIATKLRRKESFTLSWTHCEGEPGGRSTLWIHPAIALRFVFDEPETGELSRSWITDLATAANMTGGISLVPQPGARSLTLAAALSPDGQV